MAFIIENNTKQQLIKLLNLPSFEIKVDGEVLEDVHVSGMGNGGHVWRLALGPDVGDGLSAYIQHDGVHQLAVVSATWFVHHLHIG